MAKGDGPSKGIMFVSDEEVAALRAEVERAKKDSARIRREKEAMKQEKEYERLQR